MDQSSPVAITLMLLFLLFLIPVFSCSLSDEKPQPYQDPDLSVEKRVEDLLSRMTLDEKILQTSYDAPAVERLGIPAYNWWNECLHGVARAGIATVFPQAIGLAATWNTELMHRLAAATSDEARAKHHEWVRKGDRGIYKGLTFWSPNINIFRDPRWGRGMETYGEDPFLTGKMGVEFVRGLQGNDPRYLKVVATPKHYAVHSGPEPERHSFDALANERDLWDTYLRAFRACVNQGGAYSVMCAYNRYRGEACCGSPKLLLDILREKWSFEGYVVSDCGAIDDIHSGHKIADSLEKAAALAVKSGCDLNCGQVYQNALLKAVQLGLISEKEIDVSLRRLLRARFKLGMFDPPEMVPYAQIPYEVNDCSEHRALALEAARESIVLLKNAGGVLPLKKNMKKLAVIGPNADALDVLLGNYNGTPSRYVTLLEGIKRKASPGTEVLFARGCGLARGFVRLETIPAAALLPPADELGGKGLKAEVFDTGDLSGKAIMTAWHEKLDFKHGDWFIVPGRGADDSYSIRWSGRLRAPVSGRYTIGAHCDPWLRVYIDGIQVLKKDDLEIKTVRGKIELNAGREYEIRIETLNNYNKTVLSLQWFLPSAGTVEQAVQGADAAILCLGLSPQLEGEEMRVDAEGFSGGDRTTLALPGTQQELLRKVQASGVPVVLVLTNGSALAVNWADKHIPAIVEAWYPGEEGGTAVADVLFGDYNPSGRLPVTFYKSVDQLPPFADYNMEGRTYRYFRGEPLYPFGHGLSYSHFSYSNLAVEPETVSPGESVSVSVEIENAGDRAGDEVVQLYITDEEASVPVPIRALKGLTRVNLAPGEKKWMSFEITPEDMALFDDNGSELIEPGEFKVTVGGKQPGFTGNADASTTMTLDGRFRVVGEVTRID